ncbi:LemA family protein [Flavobacterium akiainvivens]|uniref:LemA family protein n=1 Tax=Flavobacterium akiainvivens TaxID=1202724 RepID=A0A0M9VJK6_9FLAO|nr:LemA family protein [Flavobacterium akiainvivens]KOS07839.1 LemA family protein [Flavobacterium akiainvivens]SFQ27333.1 LemA protein [Flavobacterium akiainvivens]
MKKWIIPVLVIGAIVVIGFFWAMNIKNGAIDKNQQVGKEWGNVETAYQRRNDLIGNLVETVKGAANFEKSTLVEVTEARSKANSVQVDPANATPEQLAAFSSAQANLMGSVNKLIGNITIEKYPELKSNQNFLKLQDELASTENTIQTQRTRYNEVVEAYNNYILRFPNSMFLGEYKEKPFFKAVEGADKPVQVKF